jgi:hypothetical protein
MTLGRHISLMGIDGAGKTSIAMALADLLKRKGYVAEVVSWKSVMSGSDAMVGKILAHHAMTSSKLQLFKASAFDSKTNLEALLSEEGFSQFRQTEQVMRQIPIERNEAFPFLSAALLELSGSVFLHHAYLSERIKDGRVVIEESCGFKHVLKNVLLAQRLAIEGTSVHMAAKAVLENAQLFFGSLLRTSHGYWIDTDPHTALEWRIRHGEPTTNFENYGLSGTESGGSFLAMQHDCRRVFALAAKEWRWARLEMLNRPKEANIRAAIETIEDEVLR